MTSVVQLKEGLERRGHRAIVITVDAPHSGEVEPTIYRFPSVPFNSENEWRLGLLSQRSVKRIVEKEQLDIVHTHTEFSIGWAAKRAAQAMRLPLIHTAHTLYEGYRHYLFLGRLLPASAVRKYLRLFLSGYDTLVCPSAKAQNYFKVVAPHTRTVVIANGVCRTRFQPSPVTREERERIRSRLGLQPSDKVVIYVGRMAKEKRALELLGILIPLLQKQPDYKALFVGCGPACEPMISVAKKNHVQKQVNLVGYVEWERIHQLYSIADLFVTASLSEVHPLTLIEASMCGLPIVARRDDSFADLVIDGYNGYLVDSDQQIADRLSEVLGEKSKLLWFSKNGLALADRFDAEGHVDKFESLYQEMMEAPAIRG